MMISRYRFPILLAAWLVAATLMATGVFAQGDTTRRTQPTTTSTTSGADTDGAALESAPLSPSSGVGNGGGASIRGARTMPAFKTNGIVTPSASASLGATVGGAQDIGYARQLIEAGQVPSFLTFSAEGLYSEHDIPTPSSNCNSPLCLSLGYGFAPTIDNSSNAIFVHLGMSSNIKAGEFKRTPLQLAIVIDRSGSMEGESMESVKKALKTLAGKLTASDKVLLISFNEEAQLMLPPISGADQTKLVAAIDALVADGSTDIEAGLRLGFSQLAALPEIDGVSKRVILFTDAQPNTGTTDSADFRTLTEQYAKEGIGLTAFGVGIDFGNELIYHISQLRGGNFFFLESAEKIAHVFDTEFDYLVTPLVYDLKVSIETPSGLKLTGVYGLPTWKPGDRDAHLEIPTVFLSSNRGAIILRYEKDGDAPIAVASGDLLASGELSYVEPTGRKHLEKSELRHGGTATLEPGTQFYTHDGMRMAVALTNIYFGLRDACRLNTEGKRQEALDAIKRAKAEATLENIQLKDAGISKEIALLDKLAKNIGAR